MSKINSGNMTVTKKEILAALEREPLAPGYWVNPNKAAGENCTVCAVGALLRSKGWDYEDLRDHKGRIYDMLQDCYSQEDDWNEALEAKNYIGALSAFFENQCASIDDDRTATPEIRLNTMRFVEENFPDSFEVYVPEGSAD